MASVFTKIIDGELPGRFVWKDDVCVAFLSIAPLAPGHTLVIPRAEVDHWLDLEPSVATHLMAVSQKIGRAQMEAFQPVRIGMTILGLEVPHTHLHVVPINGPRDLDFDRANPNASAESMDEAAAKIRTALASHGHSEVADA